MQSLHGTSEQVLKSIFRRNSAVISYLNNHAHNCPSFVFKNMTYHSGQAQSQILYYNIQLII